MPGTILRSTTRLVDVSAVVLDKHGDPVTDLKKEDFAIYDEGKLQDIRLFSAPVGGVPDSQFGTAFCESSDAAAGVTTGISAMVLQ